MTQQKSHKKKCMNRAFINYSMWFNDEEAIKSLATKFFFSIYIFFLAFSFKIFHLISMTVFSLLHGEGPIILPILTKNV